MAVTALDRSRVSGITLADAWRSFRTAIGLGWAIESNWSDPLLFAIYTHGQAARGGDDPGPDVPRSSPAARAPSSSSS